MDKIRAGIRESESSESCTRWALLPRDLADMTDEEIAHGLDMHEHYSGPGRPYANRPYIRRSAHRVLVTQDCGWDV